MHVDKQRMTATEPTPNILSHSTLAMIHTVSVHTCLEGRRAMCDESRAALANAVRKRELELWREELLDVRPANILGLFNLNNA